MNGKLRKILTECIRDIETGALDVEGCLQRHPNQAEELQSHLELRSGLETMAKDQPDFASQQRGRSRLLGALADTEKRMIPALVPVVAKAAAVVAGVALLVGSAVGTSAALGGPNVADDILSTVGITSSQGVDNAAEAADGGIATAERGAENRDGDPPAAADGRSTAEDAKDGGLGIGADNANSSASDEHGNSDNPGGNPDANADGGPGNGNGPGNVPPGPNDVPPDAAQVPDDVPPAGP
ncbi:MAG: hypothetical protein IIC86_03230 [Chloroflexi bacterium]|nr:hypothetical protein [Chloroflexota bacterium]